MRIIVLLSVFLFFFFPVFSQEISGKVFYSKEFKSPLESEMTNNPEVRKIFENINSSMKLLVYELIFNNEESIFQLQETMESDFRAISGRAIAAGRGRGLYYVNLKESYYLHESDITGQTYLVKENKVNEWELLNETKQIKGYLCYKAVLTERVFIPNVQDALIEFVAWFTPKINIASGPAGIYGLPGLILELEISNVIYRATDIVVKNEKKIINKPENGIEIYKKDYDNILLENINKIRRN